MDEDDLRDPRWIFWFLPDFRPIYGQFWPFFDPNWPWMPKNLFKYMALYHLKLFVSINGHWRYTRSKIMPWNHSYWHFGHIFLEKPAPDLKNAANRWKKFFFQKFFRFWPRYTLYFDLRGSPPDFEDVTFFRPSTPYLYSIHHMQKSIYQTWS